jgi:hypothetical protein
MCVTMRKRHNLKKSCQESGNYNATRFFDVLNIVTPPSEFFYFALTLPSHY